jgi:hypothetical protein
MFLYISFFLSFKNSEKNKLIRIGKVIFTVLGFILNVYLSYILSSFLLKISFLNFNYLDEIADCFRAYWSCSELKLKEEYLNLVIVSAFEYIQYNEYCFYIRPNTAQFIQCKIEYPKNLNWDDFKN